MRVLIVSPTYQEAENIEEFLRRARAAAPDADILVVDDSSPDGTAQIAERVANELGRIEVLLRPSKDGLGEAYRAGFGLGVGRNYDVLVQIDADLSHEPDVVPELLAAIEAGADVAIGSRYAAGGSIPHWPWYRRALSRYGNRYAAFVLGLQIRDATSGFRAYQAKTLETIDFTTTRAKGYGFQIETAYRVWRAGGKAAEVPIVFHDRVRGYSKMSWHIFAEELLLVTWWGLRDRVLRRSTAS
jgi:dolichol-phosphate mannosyltransferase